MSNGKFCDWMIGIDDLNFPYLYDAIIVEKETKSPLKPQKQKLRMVFSFIPFKYCSNKRPCREEDMVWFARCVCVSVVIDLHLKASINCVRVIYHGFKIRSPSKLCACVPSIEIFV